MNEKLIKQVNDMIHYYKVLEQANGTDHSKDIKHCEDFLKAINEN